MGGVARLDGQPVMVIGQEKGRAVKDKVYRNFGMPKPEGYRTANGDGGAIQDARDFFD